MKGLDTDAIRAAFLPDHEQEWFQNEIALGDLCDEVDDLRAAVRSEQMERADAEADRDRWQAEAVRVIKALREIALLDSADLTLDPQLGRRLARAAIYDSAGS